MADRFASLDAFIERVRNLGPELVKRAALKVPVALERELEGQIARGEDPNGKPWKLTSDGATPLRGAMGAITVRRVGSSIVVRVSGPEARHHAGVVRGGVRRQILPGSKLPTRWALAARAVLDREFRALTGGGR